MQNFDSIICISNYALVNSGLQIARLLWSGTNDKLIMHDSSSCGKKIYATLDGGSCEKMVLDHG